MNFEADLVEIVKSHFADTSISYDEDGDADYFAARYCEMQIRRIVPAPRTVHFSDELHDSLGGLAREADAKHRDKALEAWGSVFYLCHLFEAGLSVLPFLSKSICDADPSRSDGLLWDYGMHHFHLSRNFDDQEFVPRSGYLLFAIVAESDVYFVDVRPHQDREGLQWIRQDLLKIVHVNWPEITCSRELRGCTGSKITDLQKKELRRKHINSATELGGKAIAPIGLGTMGDGHSAWCRVWGDKLLHELKIHSDYFQGMPTELRTGLLSHGLNVPGGIEFKLVLLDSLGRTEELVELLGKQNCLSRDLSGMGFAVVETTTSSPVVVSLDYEE
jgi:hypothetical protein